MLPPPLAARGCCCSRRLEGTPRCHQTQAQPASASNHICTVLQQGRALLVAPRQSRHEHHTLLSSLPSVGHEGAEDVGGIWQGRLSTKRGSHLPRLEGLPASGLSTTGLQLPLACPCARRVEREPGPGPAFVLPSCALGSMVATSS